LLRSYSRLYYFCFKIETNHPFQFFKECASPSPATSATRPPGLAVEPTLRPSRPASLLTSGARAPDEHQRRTSSVSGKSKRKENQFVRNNCSPCFACLMQQHSRRDVRLSMNSPILQAVHHGDWESPLDLIFEKMQAIDTMKYGFLPNTYYCVVVAFFCCCMKRRNSCTPCRTNAKKAQPK
jgi:hypothetical protein